MDAPEVNVAQRALASPRRSRGRGSRRGGAIGVYGTYLERQSLGARALRSRAARRTRRDSAGRAVHGARARQRVARGTGAAALAVSGEETQHASLLRVRVVPRWL